MPANRFGGSGRYFHNNANNAEARGRNSGGGGGGPKPHAQPKHEQLPKKTAPPAHPNTIKVEKIKSPEVQAPIGDAPVNKMPPERKFTQRSRLFIGNLPLDMTEEEFKKLFSSYGEISETFVNPDKGFGFVRLDTRANAEKAKWELDGITLRNRQLRVRFATHGAALSVKNLSVHVSNELLEEAFAQFGQVERAVVIVDDRGRSTERGIVEFARKSSASKALQQIRDGCFLLTSSPRAVVVIPLEQEDSEDGLTEKNLQRTPLYFQEREAPPRFAQPGTFEEKFARRWKALDDLEKQQRDQLEKSIQAAKEKLEGEMENAIYEHRNMLMKEDLLRRQDELQRLEEARKRELERRQQLELAREEARSKEREDMHRRQEILRVQIEGGNFNSDPHGELGFRRGLKRPGPGYGRSASPASAQGLLQDVLAQEMMAGQGGLGPAPSRFDQHRAMMSVRGGGGSSGPMGPSGIGGLNRGFGPPNMGQRHGYADMEYEAQKRRRY